jgi:hypothetical protein
MYRKGDAAGYTKGQIDEWIAQKYGHKDPHNLTREQYDEACAILDQKKAARAQAAAADNQGGTENAQ